MTGHITKDLDRRVRGLSVTWRTGGALQVFGAGLRAWSRLVVQLIVW